MNNAKRVLAWACVAALTALPAMAQDKAKPADDKKAAPAAPAKAAEAKKGDEVVKVLIDNDKVRVSEATYKPGGASVMRERNARVTRALTAGKIERTYPDGKKEVIQWKAGETKYLPKETFINKNVGTKDMVFYVVTPK